MAIAVSYFPVYEWTTTFLLCWLSLSSTTVETWTVWTVEQLLIESLLESSLKTVSTTPRQLHVVHQRPGWKTNGNWHLTTGSSQDLTLTTGWRPNWPLHCTPAVHQSIKISILLGPRCSSKQWCKVIWTSWNETLEIAETFSMSLNMAGRASQIPIESPTSTKDPYLCPACRSLTDAQKIPTWIMDVNFKGRTNERILREHVQRIWGSQRDCLRMVEWNKYEMDSPGKMSSR